MQRSTLRILQALVLLAACDRGPRSSTPPAAPCPCDCTDNAAACPATNGTTTTDPVTPTSTGGSDDEATLLLTSANRKFAHKDGPGCLADLDRLVSLRPAFATSTATTRAFCEMLAGRCQQGKARLNTYWREEQNMHPERATTTTETMAAMYCKGGDASERDRLLAALLDLSMGMSETHTLAQCEASYATVRELKARVKPSGPDDHQLLNLRDNLYAVAPQCFARAGDCKRAKSVFLETFPPERLADSKPEQHDTIRTSVFEAMLPRCK